jgi:signal transduction histidine kinase
MRLRQTVTNLLSNAIKFTPERRQVFITARRVGHDIAISASPTPVPASPPPTTPAVPALAWT